MKNLGVQFLREKRTVFQFSCYHEVLYPSNTCFNYTNNFVNKEQKVLFLI